MKMKMKKKYKTQIPMKYSNNENEINPSRMKNGIPSLPVPPLCPYFQSSQMDKKKETETETNPIN